MNRASPNVTLQVEYHNEPGYSVEARFVASYRKLRASSAISFYDAISQLERMIVAEVNAENARSYRGE